MRDNKVIHHPSSKEDTERKYNSPVNHHRLHRQVTCNKTMKILLHSKCKNTKENSSTITMNANTGSLRKMSVGYIMQTSVISIPSAMKIGTKWRRSTKKQTHIQHCCQVKYHHRQITH